MNRLLRSTLGWVLVLELGACTVVLGDDFVLEGGGGGGGGSTTTTTTTSAGGGGSDNCGVWTDCDDLPGCETDLANDIMNCGACGHVCAGDGATALGCTNGACDPLCDGDHVDCGTPQAPALDDGCETALGTPQACSGCGHVCEGTCTNFDCDPVIVYGTAATGSVRDLLVADGAVYWSDRQFGKVARVNLDGTSYQELANGLLQPLHVAVDASFLYWHEDNGSLVQHVPRDGSAAYSNLAGGSVVIGVTPGWVYYGKTSVQRKIKDWAATPETLLTLAPTAMHVDGTDVFVATATSLRHYAEPTSTWNLLYSQSATITAITSDPTNVYWLANDDQVYQGLRNGGGSQGIGSGSGLRAIAVDGGWVYFTEQTGNAVSRVPVGGGTVQRLVTTVSAPYGLAVSGGAVYFSSAVEARIYKKQLPP